MQGAGEISGGRASGYKALPTSSEHHRAVCWRRRAGYFDPALIRGTAYGLRRVDGRGSFGCYGEAPLDGVESMVRPRRFGDRLGREISAWRRPIAIEWR